MATMRSRRRVVAAAMVVTTWMSAFPVHAQTAGRMATQNSMPLAASVHAAAREHSRFLTQTPASPPARRSCETGVATGLLGGAGVGLAAGWGLLAATGGSDAAKRVLFTFTGVGAGIGALIGAGTCLK
jgi:hypothetical protein